MDLNLAGYNVECEVEAHDADEQGDGVEFVFFFFDQINADKAWEATEKPEKSNPWFQPRDDFRTIKAVINQCCKNGATNDEA